MAEQKQALNYNNVNDVNNVMFQEEEDKPRLYYGDGPVPPDRDRRATVREALRAGVGIGIHMPDYKRRQAQMRSRERGYRRLSHEQLMDLAANLGIDNVRPNGLLKTPLMLLNEIIPVVRAMAD